MTKLKLREQSFSCVLTLNSVIIIIVYYLLLNGKGSRLYSKFKERYLISVPQKYVSDCSKPEFMDGFMHWFWVETKVFTSDLYLWSQFFI